MGHEVSGSSDDSRRSEALVSSRRMTLPDGLRAIAALLVILPHSVGLFASWPAPTMPTRVMIRFADLGARGVQIFFVLSGFVIAYSFNNKIITYKYFLNFIVRRSIRLDPPYWAAILLYCGFLAFRRFVARSDVRFPIVGQLISHFFYCQDILGYDNINPVFWTLCIEFQFYITFCLLLGASQKLTTRVVGSRWAWDKILFVIIYAISLAWPARFLDSPAGLFLPHWYAFLLGAIVWWVIEGSLPRWLGHVAILSPLVIGAAKFQGASLVVAGTAGVILVASDRHGLYRWLDMKIVQFIGKISYSIYLVHVPIAGVMVGIQTRLSFKSQLVSFILLLLLILTTIGFAFIFNRIVEAPSLLLSRRLKVRDEGGGPHATSSNIPLSIAVE